LYCISFFGVVCADGLSLKRPYDPSSQEDLSHLAKTAAVEVKEDENDSNQPTSEVLAAPDPVTSGNKHNPLTPAASVLLGETDDEMHRHLHTELMLQQMVDSTLGETPCLATTQSDAVEQTQVRSVPYPSPPLHSQGPGGGSAGAYNGQIFEPPSVVQTIDLSTNFVQHSAQTVSSMVGDVAMDFVHAETAGVIIANGAAKNGSGEPQPKRQAAYTDNELPVHMLMQLVTGDASKMTQDDKMQWVQVGGHRGVDSHHGHVDGNQPALSQPADSFSFPPKLTVDVGNVNNGIIFNFGHNVVFSPPFPAVTVGGFGDGQPVLPTTMTAPANQMNLEDMRILDGMSSGPQSMETNVGNFTSGNHAEGFINPESVGFANTSGQNSAMSQSGRIFIGNASGLSQSVVGMEISGSALHPAPIDVRNVVDLVSGQFSTSDGGGFGSSQHGMNVPVDQLHGYTDDRSEVNMEISARQIAGMNLPDSMNSPLSILTSSGGEAGNLRQSLAELIDLQQQVAASTSGAGAGSAPGSPPYRRSSVSRHDKPVQRDLVTSRPMPDAGAPWTGSDGATWPSDAVFHDSLSPCDSRPSVHTASHVNIATPDCLPGQSVTITAPNLTKQYADMFAGDHLDNNGEVFTASHGVFATSTNARNEHDSGVINWASTIRAPVDHSPSESTLLSGGGQAGEAEKEKGLDIKLLQMLVKDGGIWDPNVGLSHNEEISHTTVIDELFAAQNSAHAANISLPTVSSDVQNPAGNMYSILVGSSQPQSTAHSPTEMPLSSQSLVMSGSDVPVQNVGIVHLSQPVFSSLSETPPTMPFVLVTSLQSQDLATTSIHPTRADSC
jgi:hypothetical protein